LEPGYRLACQTYPMSDVKLHVPPESLTAPQRTQIEGLDVDVEPDPTILGLDAHLTQPTLESPQADAQNLWAALAAHGIQEGTIDFSVQQSLSTHIRDNNWHVKVALREDEIIWRICALAAKHRRLRRLKLPVAMVISNWQKYRISTASLLRQRIYENCYNLYSGMSAASPPLTGRPPTITAVIARCHHPA
jgi:RACo linker region